MSIASDVKSDIKAAKKLRLPRWAILPGIAVAFLCAWLFDHFGKLNLMLPIWNSVAVLGLMFALKWRRSSHAGSVIWGVTKYTSCEHRRTAIHFRRTVSGNSLPFLRSSVPPGASQRKKEPRGSGKNLPSRWPQSPVPEPTWYPKARTESTGREAPR